MKLLYFAWLRARIGCAEEEVELPPRVRDVAGLLDWLKSRERKTVPFSALGNNHSLDEEQHARAPESVAERDECARLMREVERLPVIYRQALMLFYYEDMTYRELAELIGITPAAVNARLTRARTMLRERMKIIV